MTNDLSQLSDEQLQQMIASQEPATAPIKPVKELSDDELLAQLGYDPDKPSMVNGSSPEAPINQSLLSSTERLTIRGLGNQKGVAKALAEKFGEGNVVTYNEGANKGEFRVKNPKTGLWHAVDPKTFDAADPWKLTKSVISGAVGVGSIAAGTVASAIKAGTGGGLSNPLDYANYISEMLLPKSMEANAKEAIGEVAENAFEIGAVGAGLATLPVTAAGIAGAAAIGGGITAARTTLGKLEGTYDAPWQEQMQEIGVDAFMGAIGQGLMPGIKFGVSKLANTGFGRAAKAWGDQLVKSGEPGVIEDIARGFAKLTGWTDRTFETYLKDGDGVQKVLNVVAKEIPENQGQAIQQMTVGYAREAAENLVRGADDLWKHNESELLRLTPTNQEFKIADMTTGFIDELKKVGVLKTVMRETDEGLTEGLRLGATLPKTKEAFEFMSFKEFQDQVVGQGKLSESEFAFSRQTYKKLKDLFTDVEKLNQSPNLKGTTGLKNVLDASKILKNITYEMRQAGISSGSNPMIKASAKAAEAFDDGVVKILGGNTPNSMGAAFKKLNADWSDYKNAIDPYKRALDRGDDAAMLQLGNKLISRPKTNNINELTGEVKAAEILKSVPSAAPKAQRLGELTQEFRRLEAVQMLQKIESTPLMSAGGAGVTATAIATGNVPVAVGAAGGAMLNSRKTTKFLIDRARASAEVFKKPTGLARAKVLGDPRIVKTLLAYPVNATQTKMETEQMLMQQIPGANGGQQ